MCDMLWNLSSVSEQFFCAVKQVSWHVCHLLVSVSNCSLWRGLLVSLCSLSVYIDIFCSTGFSHIYNTHTNTHTIVSRSYLFLCFLSPFILPTHLANLTFFLTPRAFENERPQRFVTPQSKPQKPLRMAFWYVIANVFQTKLNTISFSVFKTTLGSLYAKWGVGSINNFQNWFCT